MQRKKQAIIEQLFHIAIQPRSLPVNLVSMLDNIIPKEKEKILCEYQDNPTKMQQRAAAVKTIQMLAFDPEKKEEKTHIPLDEKSYEQMIEDLNISGSFILNDRHIPHCGYCKNDIVEISLDPTFILNTQDKRGKTLLHHAASEGQHEIAIALINAGVNINMMSERGTPLHQSIRCQWFLITKHLLDAKAEVNVFIPDHIGDSPLILASYIGGNLECVRMLIQAKADVNYLTKNYHHSAIHLASCYWDVYPTVVKLLIAAGADVNAKTNYGFTTLMSTSQRDIACITEMLLEAKADTETKDEKGYTALYHSARFSLYSALLLLQYGAQINFPSILDDLYCALTRVHSHDNPCVLSTLTILYRQQKKLREEKNTDQPCLKEHEFQFLEAYLPKLIWITKKYTAQLHCIKPFHHFPSELLRLIGQYDSPLWRLSRPNNATYKFLSTKDIELYVTKFKKEAMEKDPFYRYFKCYVEKLSSHVNKHKVNFNEISAFQHFPSKVISLMNEYDSSLYRCLRLEIPAITNGPKNSSSSRRGLAALFTTSSWQLKPRFSKDTVHLTERKTEQKIKITPTKSATLPTFFPKDSHRGVAVSKSAEVIVLQVNPHGSFIVQTQEKPSETYKARCC